MRTLAVMNQKGGSGKTTSAVNLAAALGELGRRVLVLDLDPQASATSWFGIQPDGKGLLDVLTSNVHLLDLVVETDLDGVSLVPSSAWLVGADKALAGEPGVETILRQAIRNLPRGRWQYLLMDCPPSFGLLSISALVATDEILVPVETSSMALTGLATLVQTVERVQKRLNPALTISSILVCRADLRTKISRDVLGELRKFFGSKVLRTVIRENVRLREAPSHSKPITVYAPNSSGAEDYRAAAREIAQRVRTRRES